MNDYDAKLIAALNGETVTESADIDRNHRAFNALPSMAQEAADRSTLRALGDDSATIMGAGIPQSDDYLAMLGMEGAKTALRNRLLTADPKLTAGAAERHVDIAADAAYVAAERHKYEADRLASVTEALKAQAPTATVQEKKPATREVRTYTTMDGKETARFEGPPGGRVQQIRENGKMTWL